MSYFEVEFDGVKHKYPQGTLFYEVSKASKKENIMAYKIGNEVFSLDEKVNKNVKIEFINTDDIIGNKIYKAGLKFLFEVALLECFPNLEVTYEHSVPRGMLAHVSGDKVLTQDDISVIK